MSNSPELRLRLLNMIRIRAEWLVIVCGLITITIVLFYCAWRIQITQQWLHDHRDYIQARDARWEPFIDEIEAHLSRQDEESKEIKRHQALIIQNQMRIIDRFDHKAK